MSPGSVRIVRVAPGRLRIGAARTLPVLWSAIVSSTPDVGAAAARGREQRRDLHTIDVRKIDPWSPVTN
jgi:hypothetical protein